MGSASVRLSPRIQDWISGFRFHAGGFDVGCSGRQVTTVGWDGREAQMENPIVCDTDKRRENGGGEW